MKSKILRFFTLLLASTVLTFTLVQLSPIDPVKQYTMGNPTITETQKKQIEERFGLNDEPVTRYLKWMKTLVTGDLGESVVYRRPVKEVILEGMKNTLLLMSCSWLLAGILGYLLGALMGIFSKSWFDRLFQKLCFVSSSLPTYWVGLLFLMIFAVELKWFPIGFSTPVGVLEKDVTVGQRFYHLILPALTLSFVSSSSLALYVREKTIEVYQSDYALFSKARGLSKWQIFKHHGLKHTLGIALILQFSSFAELFGGSILAENVFSYPGLGSAITAAGLKSDVPLILGITMFSVIFVFVGNALADFLNSKLDPRVKGGRSEINEY